MWCTLVLSGAEKMHGQIAIRTAVCVSVFIWREVGSIVALSFRAVELRWSTSDVAHAVAQCPAVIRDGRVTLRDGRDVYCAPQPYLSVPQLEERQL